MQNNQTQTAHKNFNRVTPMPPIDQTLLRTSGNGAKEHSHLHGDPEPSARTPSKVKSIGSCIDEEIRFRVYDQYGFNYTNWIPFRRAKLSMKVLRALGLKIVKWNRRELVVDLFLTSDGTIEREVIQVLEH